jgi:hypothetical protein
MLELISSYSAEFATIVAVVVAFVLERLARPKAKLIYSVRHAFTFIVDQPLVDSNGNELESKQFVNTASISVSNLGVEKADNIELVFNWRPQFINVWPSRYYEQKDCSDGRHSLILSTLAPGEVFGAEIMSINAALPGINNVRSDQCEATSVPMIPQVLQPRWKVALVALFLFIGVGTAIYAAVLGVQFLASN